MKTRIQWIDIAKGLGIILVIIGHAGTPNIIGKYIYGFHMPLFFIISGYLYSSIHQSGSLKELIQKRYKNYLVPYFVLGLINWIINIVHESFSIQGKELWSSTAKHALGVLIGVSSNGFLPNCTPIWFLPCIFLSTIYLYCLLTIKNMPLRLIICLCGLDIVKLLCHIKTPHQLPWHFDTAILGCILMLIGYEMKERKLLDDNKLKPIWVCVLFLIGIFFITKNDSHTMLDMNNSLYGNLIFMLCGSVCISYVFMWICTHIRKCDFISCIGRGTIIVMGFNYIFNDIIKSIWIHIPKLQENPCPWWLLSIAVTLLCYCTIYIWNILHIKPSNELKLLSYYVLQKNKKL